MITSPRLMAGFVVWRSVGKGRIKCNTEGTYSDIICVKKPGFRSGKEKGLDTAGRSQKGQRTH